MAAAQFLRHCFAPGRPERALLLSAALGAVALIDPAKLRPGRRAAYRLATAGTTAALVAGDTGTGATGSGLTGSGLTGTPVSAGTRAALATAAGGAVLGLAEASEALDTRLQRGLIRRGVRRPRLVFAAATFALTLAVEIPAVIAARKAPRSGIPVAGRVADGDLSYLPLAAGARALIAGMLDFSAEPSSEPLRTQLAAAREKTWDGVSGSFGMIVLDVQGAEALPRAVPHRQQFPVVAEFADPTTGEQRVLRLSIEDGQLEHFSIEAGGVHAAAHDIDSGARDELWPRQWPAVAEVTFTLETSLPVDTRAAKRLRASAPER